MLQRGSILELLERERERPCKGKGKSKGGGRSFREELGRFLPESSSTQERNFMEGGDSQERQCEGSLAGKCHVRKQVGEINCFVQGQVGLFLCAAFPSKSCRAERERQERRGTEGESFNEGDPKGLVRPVGCGGIVGPAKKKTGRNKSNSEKGKRSRENRSAEVLTKKSLLLREQKSQAKVREKGA